MDFSQQDQQGVIDLLMPQASFHRSFGTGRELHPIRKIQNDIFASRTPSIRGMDGDLSLWIAASAGASGGCFTTPSRGN